MPRLSRAQSQARTRDQLLATAKASFLRDGYAGASIEQIALAAGYSKGAVYSNFDGKDDLCLAVLDAIRAERIASLAQVITAASTIDGRLAALERWAERHIGDRAWTALEVEFGVHAARDPALARELARRNAELRERAAAVLAAFAAGGDRALPLPAHDAALALLSLGIGLGVQRAIDPRVPARVLADVLRVMARR